MEIQLQSIQNKLIDKSILYAIFFAYPLLVASLIRISLFGWISLFYFHIAFAILITLLYLFRQKLSVLQKVFAFSFIYYLFSFVGSLYFGLASALFFYVFVVIINSVILGRRYGIIALVLAVVGIVIAALLHSYGFVTLQADLNSYNSNFLSWISYMLAFIFIFSVSIATIGMYNDFFTSNIDALKQKIADYQMEHEALEVAKVKLELQNDTLRDLNQEYVLALEKAEESNRLKTAFLQNVSHEIRTPLNAIEGFSNMLNMPDLTEEKRKRFTSLIISSSGKLLSVVSDIITISSLETKQQKVEMQRVNVNSILQAIYEQFNSQIEGNRIMLSIHFPLPDRQAEIVTDGHKLERIVSSLLSNALKFTSEGVVEFGYTLIKDELQFYVKDSGVGIEGTSRSKIFESFWQQNNEVSRKLGGTGLGLSIAKGFVELLGGRIWVESEVGLGSVFYFTLPYRV
ncbi:MAG: hypothetical protein H6536_00810 [Bacteroidales bacterium]|nr:hypothetical protein [Bacteroidales bacterium]